MTFGKYLEDRLQRANLHNSCKLKKVKIRKDDKSQ